MEETELRELKNKILNAVSFAVDKVLREHFEPNEASDDEANVRRFIFEKCYESPTAKVSTGELYAAYNEWANTQNVFILKHRTFTLAVDAATAIFPNVKRVKKTDGYHWRGLGLKGGDIDG